MKKIAAIIIALYIPSFVLAAEWSPVLSVEEIFTENSDLIVAVTTGGTQITDGCLVDKWIFKADNEDRRARAYSTLLAALISEKKVRFWVQDSCAEWNYHKIYAVKIIN